MHCRSHVGQVDVRPAEVFLAFICRTAGSNVDMGTIGESKPALTVTSMGQTILSVVE
jgi:hypothetical protein